MTSTVGRSRASALLTLSSVLLPMLLNACQDLEAPVAGELAATADRQVAGRQTGSLPPTYDEELAKLAELVPGFGGFARDETTGRVNVFLMNLSSQEQARSVVGAYLAQGDANLELGFLQGQFDFRDLMRWRRAIDRSLLPYVTLTDIDETKNRILVGVRDGASQTQTQRALDSLQVPRSAVTTVVTTAVQLTNLQGYNRPLVGGIQVKAVPDALPYAGCSLGYVAIRQYPNGSIDPYGPRYVTTASHCTDVFAVLSSDVIGQPEQASTPVGVEVADPPLVSSATDPACPHVTALCRRSDVALFLLNTPSGFDNEFGAVATASGLTYTGLTYYAGKQQGWSVGLPVSKVGRTTGMTSGAITQTCANSWLPPSVGDPSGHQMVCQFYANFTSGAGDSGGPVWHTSANGQRWLIGMNWGRITFEGTGISNAIFSGWMDASAEISNDIFARTGLQWSPIFTTGPAHF